MMKKLTELFEEANRKFLDEQKDFIISGVSERSLCGELSNYLIKEITETEYSAYHVDIEYNRNLNGTIKTIMNDEYKIISITCDIIVHSRGKNLEQDNLIAFEMKKSDNSNKEKEKDKERLICLTRDSFDNVWSADGKSLPQHVCRYVLGIYYEINLNKRIINVEYYEKGHFLKEYKLKF